MQSTLRNEHTGTTADTGRSSERLTSIETQEFASVLGLSPQILQDAIPAVSTSVAGYGPSYDDLTRDPIKDLLAQGPDYYRQIKARLLRRVTRRHFEDRRLSQLRLLDVGCGPGGLMRDLDATFQDVWGCDPARSMVRRAGTRAVQMTSPVELPFAGASFDVIVCACVYHHVQPDLRARHLTEVSRVLRSGGLFFMFEHNPLNPLTRFIVRRCPLDADAHLLGAGQARRLVRGAGFTNVAARYYLFFPQCLDPAFGWLESLLSVTALGGQYCIYGVNP